MYGKLIDNQIIFAPQTLLFEDGGCICNPNDEDFIQNGWKEIIEIFPDLKENETYNKSYSENSNSIIVNYEIIYFDNSNIKI